jgi:hypothetical protein
MQIRLLKIGRWYLKLEIPLVFTDFVLGAVIHEGFYKMCTDQTMNDCKTFKFSELCLGLAVINFSFGVETEIENNKIFEQCQDLIS